METRLEKVSSLRLVFLLSPDDPGPWDPVAEEPSTSPGKSQDLAGPETLEADATSVSILHMRAMRALTFCSISANGAILAERVLFLRKTLAELIPAT